MRSERETENIDYKIGHTVRPLFSTMKPRKVTERYSGRRWPESIYILKLFDLVVAQEYFVPF